MRSVGREGRMKDLICFIIVLLFLGFAELIAGLIFAKDEPTEDENEVQEKWCSKVNSKRKK